MVIFDPLSAIMDNPTFQAECDPPVLCQNLSTVIVDHVLVLMLCLDWMSPAAARPHGAAVGGRSANATAAALRPGAASCTRATNLNRVGSRAP